MKRWIFSFVMLCGSVHAEVSYFHADHLGSMAVATNAAGAVRQVESYTPFGETVIARDPALAGDRSNLPTHHLFTNQELDRESELSYYGARYYDPTLSRFLSVDPFFDTTSSYAYVGNNPNSYSDPDGKSREDSQLAKTLLNRLRELHRQLVLLQARAKDLDREISKFRRQGVRIIEDTADSTGPHSISVQIRGLETEISAYEGRLGELGYKVNYRKTGSVSMSPLSGRLGRGRAKLGAALFVGFVESFLTEKAVAASADRDGIPVDPVESVYHEGLNDPAGTVQKGANAALSVIGVLAGKEDYRKFEEFVREVTAWWTGGSSQPNPTPDPTVDLELLKYCGHSCE